MTSENEALLEAKEKFLESCEEIAKGLQKSGYTISSHEPQHLFKSLLKNDLSGSVLIMFVATAVESGVVIDLDSVSDEVLRSMASVCEEDESGTIRSVFVKKGSLGAQALKIVWTVSNRSHLDEWQQAKEVCSILENGNPVLAAFGLQLLAHKAPKEIFPRFDDLLSTFRKKEHASILAPAFRILKEKNPEGLIEWVIKAAGNVRFDLAGALPQSLLIGLAQSHKQHEAALKDVESSIRGSHMHSDKIGNALRGLGYNS